MATEELVVTEVVAPEIGGASVTIVVENEPVVIEPAEGKPSKSKKITNKRKPRSPSLHPPYFEMIKEAILALKEKNGSSQYAIAKFVEEKHKNLPAMFKKVLLVQLKRLVADGKLVKVKASYKLPAAKLPAAKVAPVKKKKKPVVVKPKASAKPKAKPAAKKAVVAKKKPAVKAKPAPKAKPVAKAKVAAPKAVVKPAVKAKPKAMTKSAKVAKTSTRSTPRGKAAPAPKPVKVARTSTRSTPRKASAAAVAKPAPKKVAAAAKSVKGKAATPKKAVVAAKRKGRK